MQPIDWNYPTPRTGWRGAIDRFVGPGATQAELTLQLALPIVAVVGAVISAATRSIDWTVLQYVVAGFLAMDIMGGVVTNATSTAKRWYHRVEKTERHHLAFIAVHLVHLSLVSWIFLGWQWHWVASTGAYLIVAAVAVLRAPLYLQRPISLTVFTGGLLLSQFVVASPLGLEWFLPLFYLKLLVSHLPKEEPYRPAASGNLAAGLPLAGNGLEVRVPASTGGGDATAGAATEPSRA